MAMFSVSKSLNTNGENPYCVAVNSDEPRVSLFM